MSAWSTQHQLVLGQSAVDVKSNEIMAIPILLKTLDIENAIITLDAMGCQEEIAKQIIHQKGDYILALKGNHSGLLEELLTWHHKCEREGLSDENFATDSTTDGDDGRIETEQNKTLFN